MAAKCPNILRSLNPDHPWSVSNGYFNRTITRHARHAGLEFRPERARNLDSGRVFATSLDWSQVRPEGNRVRPCRRAVAVTPSADLQSPRFPLPAPKPVSLFESRGSPTTTPHGDWYDSDAHC